MNLKDKIDLTLKTLLLIIIGYGVMTLTCQTNNTKQVCLKDEITQTAPKKSCCKTPNTHKHCSTDCKKECCSKK
ncbi:hypothetical protein DID76_02480 [Candidatus Marinamargulisbacteria bacterium SCGC AG-414-C22]|nr:hypothetical protein DID76_02480 [Candidatus Marinamargulisbacteria bacterium SCGC AG-414-C22]